MDNYKKCLVKNCENKYKQCGYCSSHYMQMWRYGKIIDEQREKEKKDRINRKCKVENCDGSAYWRNRGIKGYCYKHYEQLYQNGKILKRTHKDKNEIINYDNYCEIILYNFANKGEESKEIARTQIDKEDLEKIKNYKWGLNGSGYAYNVKNKIFLHHLIIGRKKGFDIDHINHNKLDNRKYNLRFATRSQNNMNKKVKGYCWDKSKEKWMAYIIINGKQIFLGYFINEQDADKTRKMAEQKYFGEYAYKNIN